MGVVLVIVVAVVMIIALAAAIVANVGLLRTWRSSWGEIVEHSPKSERAIVGQTALTFGVVGAWFVAVLAQPFGLRETLTCLVAVPVLVLVLGGLSFVGIRGYRDENRRRSVARRDSRHRRGPV